MVFITWFKKVQIKTPFFLKKYVFRWHALQWKAAHFWTKCVLATFVRHIPQKQPYLRKMAIFERIFAYLNGSLWWQKILEIEIYSLKRPKHNIFQKISKLNFFLKFWFCCISLFLIKMAAKAKFQRISYIFGIGHLYL